MSRSASGGESACLPAEREQGFWELFAAPLAWLAFFMLSSATAALWCARIGPAAPAETLRLVIGAYALAALLGIAHTARRAWARYRDAAGAEVPEDRDTPSDGHRFLAHASLLLAGLSALATLYTSMAVILLSDCR